ncbi:MAG: metallopeptidase family protein [Spirochaetota bacterium]
MNIPAKKFEDLVMGAAARIVASLPPELRSKAEEVIFTVADRPSLEQSRSVGDEDDTDAGDLLGLYEGISLIDRKIDDMPVLPDRITLFRIPFADMCRNERELREEIRLTIIHELGHFFGFEEGDLEERGLG